MGVWLAKFRSPQGVVGKGWYKPYMGGGLCIGRCLVVLEQWQISLSLAHISVFLQTQMRTWITIFQGNSTKHDNAIFRAHDGYYVVGVIPILYPEHGCIITIVSKEEKTYLVSIAYILQYTCPDFVKMLYLAVGKKGQSVSCKHLYYMFRYLCKVDVPTNKFIHALTFSYNEVMCLLELAGVAEYA